MSDHPNSCLYEGWVRHRRHAPVANSFTYRLFMLYLDLAELPGLFDPYLLWSARHPALAWFRRSDYHGDPDMTLDSAVRATIESATGTRPPGPVRLLTHLRYFGFAFNPVSFYFVYDEADTRVETILAEITNTPWRERRGIVLDQSINIGTDSVKRFCFAKDFHVSPFMDMDVQYDWRMIDPGKTFIVTMADLRKKEKLFDATLSLKRRPITKSALTRVLWRYPLMTMRIVSLIHWQALKLWYKGATFHDHPKLHEQPFVLGPGRPTVQTPVLTSTHHILP